MPEAGADAATKNGDPAGATAKPGVVPPGADSPLPDAPKAKNKKKAAKKKKKNVADSASDNTSPTQPTPSAGDVLQESLFGGGQYNPTATKQIGVGVMSVDLPELLALQDFSLKYTSPKQGRPRGIGIEPVSPGIRYDFSNADSSFEYAMSATWRKLEGHARMRHVTAVCGMRTVCTVDVNYQLDTEVPVLAGFGLHFTEHHDMTSISIMPDGPRDYVVQVKGSGRGTYVVDLYLAMLDKAVVRETAMTSGERKGTGRAAFVDQIDMENPTPKTHPLLQGFSVSMTDGPHPVAELSISNVGIAGPARVVFQDATGTRPMKARIYWVLAQ